MSMTIHIQFRGVNDFWKLFWTGSCIFHDQWRQGTGYVKGVRIFMSLQSRMQNYWRDFFELGVAFHGLRQKQQQICTSIWGHGVSTVSTSDLNMLH